MLRQGPSRILRASARRHNSSAQPRGPGLGLGVIRQGVDAVHRVHVEQPKFLKSPKTVSVVGAPMIYGQPLMGADFGPKAIREAGLHSAIKKLGWFVDDQGDLDLVCSPADFNKLYTGVGNMHHPYPVCHGCETIHKRVHSCAELGRLVLTIGGDHSIGLGTIAGMLKKFPDLGVIWVDAHADVNTPQTSPSGNMHGMPLSMLLGMTDPDTVPGLAWLKDVPKLLPEQLVYIGLRDVDKGERDIIREHNITAFTMHHVDKMGIGPLMVAALEKLKGRPIHMSYDIDACDPAIAPHTGTAVRGGLNFREAHFVAEAVAETGQLVSMDLVEVNPTIDADKNRTGTTDETVELGLQLIAGALGNRIL